jgi:TonB family protein
VRNFESWMLSYLLNSLWQIPLLFTAGWVAARVARTVGAAAQHRVWVGVLLLQCILPAGSALPWEWLGRILNWASEAHGDGEPHVSVAVGAGSGLGGFQMPGELLAAIAIVYGLVCGYFLLRFVWRCRRLAVLGREAVEASLPAGVAGSWTHWAKRFGIGDATIATSAQIFGPVTLGISRRLVLLPDRMAGDLQTGDLQTVIAHEFAHIRRNDFLKNLVYELLALPVSYHPLFRMTRERLMESREMVCDEMAATLSGRNEYAHSLLRLASLLVEGMPVGTPHAIGIFDANTLERRLMRLTERQNEIRGVRRVGIAAACILLGAGTCASALALRMHVDAAAVGSDNNAAKTEGPRTVPAEEMAANRLSGPNPKYPIDAKKARIQGTVVLNAVIGKDGSVEKVLVASGPKELQQSSLDAVRQWTYKPYLVNGEPVDIKTTIKVVYTLAK